MNFIKNIVSRIAPKVSGKHILFLSDDWGGVRLSSKEAQTILKQSNLISLENRFDKYDMLESNIDMESLFDVLMRHSDFAGKHPVMTALCNVANPHFEKIRDSGFSEYHFEPFTETLSRYPCGDKVYEYYLEGIKNKLFLPEFHGREHVQIVWWLRNLQNKNSQAHLAFEQQYFFLSENAIEYPEKYGLDAAFNFWEKTELEAQKETLVSGLNLFSSLLGYNATLFTPPSLIMHKSLEATLRSQSVSFLDKPSFERMPKGKGKIEYKLHYTGQKSNSGVKYLVRNAVFEPNMHPDSDGVDTCLAQIATAFKNSVPAIISNHRAAFVGGIDPANRDKGLKALDTLLKKILQTWPDVEFITVRELDNVLTKPSNK